MKILLSIPILILISNHLHAKIKISTQEKTVNKKKIVAKQRIQCNMTVKYKKRPKRVDEFSDILTKGILYGRFRTNTFLFDAGTTGKNHYSVGIGGNLTYKSARYKGFSFTSGLYTSQNPNHVNEEDLGDYRYGKDTFSRHSVATKGRDGMTVLTENYLSYKKSRAELKVGRFLLETFLLKSHDTKMIPNAFEGVHLRVSTIPKTKIQFAYITKQKLRDHEKFHRVLAYNDDISTPYAKWTENDDGAMHRGLTVSKLDEKGIEDKIIVFETQNRTFKNTTFKMGYTTVPELISSYVLEGTYKFQLNSGLKIKPSIRYMGQIDDGAGAIGGANLKTDTTGYSNPDSLQAALLASRIDFIYGDASLRIGYSKTSDSGDIIAPWHAQPSAGYTRQMSGMNWYANTKSTMVRADYDFSSYKMLEGIHLMSRYTIHDYDDAKPGVTSDMNVFTVDIIKRFKENPNLLLKMRSAFVKEDHKVANIDGSYKKDPSYNAVRLEMNYLF
jgi:hypothetical protein